jgi:hypothetical protein
VDDGGAEGEGDLADALRNGVESGGQRLELAENEKHELENERNLQT